MRKMKKFDLKPDTEQKEGGEEQQENSC